MDLKASQRGSALIYILVAIALLAALTASFMGGSGQQASSQNILKTVSDIQSQIEFIRASINECVLNYPKGDLAIAGTGIVGGDTPVRPYPLNPYNTYLAATTPSSSLVSDIRCPGNPGNSNNHSKIFGGTTGNFLPKPPALFTPWFYYNNIDGVFIYIGSGKTDGFLDTVFKKLDANFAKCEAQYVDATAGLVHLTSNSNTGFTCGAGSRCLRVLIKPTATTIYPGDTGCP